MGWVIFGLALLFVLLCNNFMKHRENLARIKAGTEDKHLETVRQCDGADSDK